MTANTSPEIQKNHGFENPNILGDNQRLREHVISSIREITKTLPSHRVLDYGIDPHSRSASSQYYFWDDQETFGYSPALNENQLRTIKVNDQVRHAINTLPEEQDYDLALFSASLHHTKNPTEAIAEVKTHGTPYIAIIEGNYQDTTDEVFKEEFGGDAGITEIREEFGGDWGRGREFHSRFTLEDYENSARENGYEIVAKGYGEGKARHKFFLVGKRS